jgi:hypothetical protein
MTVNPVLERSPAQHHSKQTKRRKNCSPTRKLCFSCTGQLSKTLFFSLMAQQEEHGRHEGVESDELRSKIDVVRSFEKLLKADGTRAEALQKLLEYSAVSEHSSNRCIFQESTRYFHLILLIQTKHRKTITERRSSHSASSFDSSTMKRHIQTPHFFKMTRSALCASFALCLRSASATQQLHFAHTNPSEEYQSRPCSNAEEEC